MAPKNLATQNVGATIYMPAKLNLPPPRDSPSVIKLQPSSLVARKPVMKPIRRPHEHLIRDLDLVKLQLTRIVDSGRKCQNSMHDLFELHELLQHSDVQDTLMALSQSLDCCHGSATMAVDGVKSVVDFVGHDRENVVL